LVGTLEVMVISKSSRRKIVGYTLLPIKLRAAAGIQRGQ